MPGWARYVFALVLALLASPMLAPPALAVTEAAKAARSQCHAVGTPAEPLADVLADATRWTCDGSIPRTTAGRVWLRFSTAQSEGARVFAARPTLFDSLTIAAVAGPEVLSIQRYASRDLMTGPGSNFFTLPLPSEWPSGAQVVVGFDAPGSRGLFTDAALYRGDPLAQRSTLIGWLVAAAVCGMLLMPLAFNAAYYRALRESFVLWHLVVTATLIAQCLLTSGLLGLFVDIPIPVHARLGIITGGFAAAAAATFCATFIERGKLDRRLRRGLYVAAAYTIAITLLHAAFPSSVDKAIYYASFVPIIALAIAVMIDARRRGSRAVRYQIAAWTPVIAMGVVRITTMLVPSLPPLEVMPLFYFAMVVQSATTSLGIADRFLVIKRQRDSALDQAQSFARLSERDALTGLFNRRALDGALGNFAAQRFTGFALFDLDNFKRVNDTHGHATGDAALRTVAAVLAGHDDAVAVRIGGEEFLLLLRGANVAERVERLREAIPVRIAREVDELEMLVTSSAGLVEAAIGSTLGGNFGALYRQADELLYEAKHNGRNLLAAVRNQAVASIAPAAAA